jgi:hypothetical protein
MNIYNLIYWRKNMKRNINVLRLAGLLTEDEALRQQGLYVEQDPSQPAPGGSPAGDSQGMPPPPEAGAPPEGGEGGEEKPEDPAALLDQAIELLNKIKGTMGGGDSEPKAEPTPPPQGF